MAKNFSLNLLPFQILHIQITIYSRLYTILFIQNVNSPKDCKGRIEYFSDEKDFQFGKR